MLFEGKNLCESNIFGILKFEAIHPGTPEFSCLH